jgi:hypothetical protein
VELVGHVLGGERERQDGGVGPRLDGRHRAVVLRGRGVEHAVPPVGERLAHRPDGGAAAVDHDGAVAGFVVGGEQRVEGGALAVGGGITQRPDGRFHHAGDIHDGALGAGPVFGDGGLDGGDGHGHTDDVDGAAVVDGRGRRIPAVGHALLEARDRRASRCGVVVGERYAVDDGGEAAGEPPAHRPGPDHEQVHARSKPTTRQKRFAPPVLNGTTTTVRCRIHERTHTDRQYDSNTGYR